MLHASSMSYASLGSIVPLLAVIFAVVSMFQPLTDPNADWFSSFRIYVLKNLAPQTGERMVQVLEQFLLRTYPKTPATRSAVNAKHT